MLDVRRLKLLSELAKRGTIASVARAAGYTPSAVSQALAQLERESGVALLERHGRGVSLTRAARTLVARADRILAELDAAEAELAAEHGVVQGEVVVGAFPSAANELVIGAVTALSVPHPELRIALREHEPEDGVALLRSGDLDLLITERYEGVDAGPIGGLEVHPLLSEALLLVTSTREQTPDPVDLGRYREARWVGGNTGTQYAIAVERSCERAGFVPSFVHRADEASVIQAIAGSGLAVALLPALACTSAPQVQYRRAMPTPPARHVYALVRAGAAQRPALRVTLETLAERARVAARSRIS